MNPTPLLDGKVAFLTGAADGIGRAIAELFFLSGATVWLTDINEEKGRAEAVRLNESLPASEKSRAFFHPCDTGSSDAVEAAVARVLKDCESIDILVNNAAVALGGNPLTMAESDWDKVMNINLTGYWRTIRSILPGMLARQSGSIINLSSTQAHRSWPDWTAYAAAKGGVIAMTRQLAGQFSAQGVRFNSISPGAIDTPMNEARVAQEGEALRDKWAQMHALGRTGKPSEVAQTALFLASGQASFITGQDILVDGGLTTLPRYFD